MKYDDLVERLRALVVLDEVGSHNQLGQNAALAITALQSQVRELEDDSKRLDFLQNHVSAIRDIGWITGDLRMAIDRALLETRHE